MSTDREDRVDLDDPTEMADLMRSLIDVLAPMAKACPRHASQSRCQPLQGLLAATLAAAEGFESRAAEADAEESCPWQPPEPVAKESAAVKESAANPAVVPATEFATPATVPIPEPSPAPAAEDPEA